MSYDLITCIVEKGKGESIVDEAIKRGAQGATYFSARGKGVREKLGLTGVFISAEKEVILIVVRTEQARALFDSIVVIAALKEKGRGFAYIQPVIHAVGFLE